MRRKSAIRCVRTLVVSAFAIVCVAKTAVYAQQQESQQPQDFSSAYQKADQACKALWADHAFDPWRSKIAFTGETPTLAMLTDKTRLRPKDRPLAEFAIKLLAKCRSLYADAYALLPQQTRVELQALNLEQDSLIAQLYVSTITTGEYNVGMNRISAKMINAIWGDVHPVAPNDNAKQVVKAPATQTVQQQLHTAQPRISNQTRLALVIGNSKYTELPKLKNTANDAQAVVDSLRDLGYEVTLVSDASEQSIRRAVRKFADQSAQADLALVYYAGHGAQLNGASYLLPVDMEIPHTEADIELSSLKLDDLVNSIRSTTKVVFLDACRDNPALMKNLVKGRGAIATGLAPVNASHFTNMKPGGGVFIAYATEAGSVALEGQSDHSPFTEALLRNLKKPISIDDMFSWVTREVRLVTKNAQRPYKYASLENIVCLTPACSNAPIAPPADIVQQVRQSEDEEFQIALQPKNLEALETFLQKYPETTKRVEVLGEISSLRRSELAEWTLFEVGGQTFPQYMQLSSIQHLGDRAAAKQKQLVNPSVPKVFLGGKTVPDAAYFEDLFVYDCTQPRMAIAEESVFDQSGNLRYHYKVADPQYLNPSMFVQINPGVVGLAARNIACHSEIEAPLISKRELVEMKFPLLASTSSGDGEMFYVPSQNSQNDQDQKEVILILRFNADRNVKEFLPQGISIPNPPNFRTEIDHLLFKCNENKVATKKFEQWNTENQLVRIFALDPTTTIPFDEIKPFTPNGTLQEIVCAKSFGGVGIRYGQDGNLAKVTEVVAGSPAEKVGIKPNDLVTHVDGASITGLSAQQINEKIRGPIGSKVVLTIVRQGQDEPLNITAVRERIQAQAMQPGPSK